MGIDWGNDKELASFSDSSLFDKFAEEARAVSKIYTFPYGLSEDVLMGIAKSYRVVDELPELNHEEWATLKISCRSVDEFYTMARRFLDTPKSVERHRARVNWPENLFNNKLTNQTRDALNLPRRHSREEEPVMGEVHEAIKEGIKAVHEGRSPEEAIAKIFGEKPDEGYSEHVKTTFIYAAERLVYKYVKAHLEKTDTHVTFGPDEVYVVWFCKTLQHWKALVSTTLPDGMYYEVTHNGDKNETYIDAYKKFDNVVVPD